MIKGARRLAGSPGSVAPGPAKTDPTEYEKNYLIPKLPTTPTGMTLMLTLAGYGYDGKEISASVGTLAASAGISERSVQRYLKEFVEKGWLTPTYKSRGLADESGQRTNKYRLNWPEIIRAAEKNYEKNLGDHEKRRANRPRPSAGDRSNHKIGTAGQISQRVTRRVTTNLPGNHRRAPD